MRDGPALSVVLVADEPATVRRTVEHLRAQDVAPAIELVLVQPPGAAAEPADGLWGVQPVDASIESPAEARWLGAQAARAPIVAFGETHSYPQPGWAAALLAAHERDVAAVGPAVGNANPGSAISWANLLIDYGPWLEADEPGPRDDLPGHNSSYKRELLLAAGGRLENPLEHDYVMNARLRLAGRTLWLEPGMRTLHLNVTKRGAWLPERFRGGRHFAATRTQDWPRWRRGLFAAATPVLPLVRAYRTLPAWRRATRHGRLPWRTAPALLAGLVTSAAGELAGCVAGAGSSASRLAEIELHREDYVRTGESRETSPRL